MERYHVLRYQLCFLISLVILQEITAKGCAEVPVGLNSREQFPDHYFHATSFYSKNTLPHLARLDSETTWSPSERNNSKDYFQIDLGLEYQICGIGTKGSLLHAEWITKYKLAFSVDNTHWAAYKENGNEKIFSGNSDHNTLRKNVLVPHYTARLIRLHPTAYHNWKSLRIELYGIQLDNCKYPLGFENYGISNSQLTASSELQHEHGRYGPHASRLHGKHSWRSRHIDDPSITTEEYIHVDLGQVKTVSGIATQGDASEQMWVTSYNLEFKRVGGNWYEYTPSNDKESFEGNVDNTGLVIHWFDIKHHVRYMRLLPKTWKKAIALRMEIYGCQDSCEKQAVGIQDRRIISDDVMTSSSRRSNTTHAYQGRLLYTKHSSWCASGDDTYPYLQIDLSVAHVLCGIATQGNSKADQWVESYTLITSLDGQNWEYYREDERNIMKFVGNFDGSSVSKHFLNNSTLAQFVRFLPDKFHGDTCMRVEVYGTSHDVCSKTIAGASATGRIPDYRFTGSSSFSTYYKPSFGRLNGPSCWAAETNTRDDFLQIDLGDPHIFCGVSTQSCGANSEKVLSYSLAFSMDGKRWESYQRTEGEKKIFIGNQDDQPSVKRHSFNKIRTAKFVRFFPVTYHYHKSMRVEVYGLRQGWRESLGVEADHRRTKIPDNHLTASSISDADHVEAEGRLYGSSSWCTKDTHNPYFQVDFHTAREVVAIATQGDPVNVVNYVKEYNIHYGFTSDRWMKVEHVEGNIDGNTVRVHWLNPSVGARYVRLVPADWNGDICMRIDIYGNQQVPPPTLTSSKVIGQLQALPSSHVTIRCLATADSKLHFKWFSSGNDVTSKCSGKVYSRGQVSSSLKVNFTSASDILLRHPCVSLNHSASRCRLTFTCQAFYGDVMGERKEHTIDVDVRNEEKATPTTSVVTPTSSLSSEPASGTPTAEKIANESSISSPNSLGLFLVASTLILFKLYH